MLPVIAAIAALGSSAIGAITSSDAANRATKMTQDAYNEYLKLGYPPDMAGELAYKELTQAGVLTPELEDEIVLGASKLQNVQPDQELLGTRKAALQKLMGLSETGLSPIERAQAQELQAQVAGDEKARQQQILESRQARGQGGSGDALASALISSQAATNRQSQSASNLNAQAYQRALEALGRGTSLAGELQREDTGLQEKKATAADEISRYNTQNSVERQRRNLQRMNEATAANLSEKQRVQDTNTKMFNAEQLRRRDGARQTWQDQNELARLKANAKLGLGVDARRDATETRDQWQKIGAGAGGFIDKLGQKSQDEILKDAELDKLKDIKPDYVGPYSSNWYSGYNSDRE